MQVTTVGANLAKNVFQVHGITKTGEVPSNRSIRICASLGEWKISPLSSSSRGLALTLST